MWRSGKEASYEPIQADPEGLGPLDARPVQRNLYFTRKSLILIASLAANVILAYILSFSDLTLPATLSRSRYAGLLNDLPQMYQWTTEYSDPNNPGRDNLWNSDFYGSLNHAMVAITEEESKLLSLPPSEVPYIWKSSKGTYVLEAHHSLHCLRLIYGALAAYRGSRKQEVSHQHIVHCLDNLRQNVLCQADDTPRFLTLNGTHAGEGQTRMCRDFSKLNAWAAERDACYRHIDPPGPDMAEIERYKYCKREGSDMDKVRKFFGFKAEWQPFPFKAPMQYITKQGLKEKLNEMSRKEKAEFEISKIA